VTKEALFKAVWQKDNPAYAAGDEVMTTCIYSLRQKLKDTGKPSRYIETTYKQGYRFIGPVAERAPVDPASSRPEREEPQTVSSSRSLPTVVGREEELSSLQQALDAAMAGARQVVFVTGEPGIGKTSLVRAFLQRVLDTGHAIVGQGQCVEHYGAGEAYLPILDALGRLCHEPGGNDMVEWMAQHAPTWLVQMPALVDAGKLEALQRRVQGATRERMLREMREGLEALTQNKPLVLVLEDLHWSDSSTLDLLRALAQGQGPARLCILGTYRPHEGLAEGHPLRSLTQELYGHGQGAEISLALLTNEAVDQYLVARFPRHGFPPRFAQVLYQLTDGNPFFLVALIDDLLRRGIIAEVDERWALQREIELIAAEVPENVRQLIGRQIDRLKGVEQRILAAASVVGLQFSAAAVAATVELPTADIEEACTVLARRQLFLQPAGVSEWPDGTMAGSYRFRHALHQYLWSERVTPSQLQQFHRRIGERLEQAYGKHVGEIAVELALHFEQGRDYERAVQYLQQAAANAMQRSACQEAIGHLTRGLNFLNAFPETLSRIEREINLQVMLGTAFMVVQGFAAPTVVNAHARAQELC
jgi:predicted ATPase